MPAKRATPPPNVLFSWIGTADIEGMADPPARGVGPLASAVAWERFHRVVALGNFSRDRLDAYVTWLRGRTDAEITLHPVDLDHPMHFEQIYRAVVGILEAEHHSGPLRATYHLSPGTSAMAAIWLLLAKTRFPGRLIQSSLESGVVEAEIPFDLTVDFLPDFLRAPDAHLRELSAARAREGAFRDIVGDSPAITRAIALAERVAQRSVPVLLLGESGSGKELFASAIHASSPRAGKPWRVLNCGGIPSELVESTLFGHRRGAFTGAHTDQPGVFEAAHGGTLFLDEVGELPLAAQVKLLRVLQSGTFTRVGDSNERQVDVRIVAATHRDLTDEVREGRFREDLYYRLAVAVIWIPPLRERGRDLSLLIDALLDQINAEHRRSEVGYVDRKLSSGARRVLLAHRWPGNVRELYNTLVRATIWAPDPTIRAEDVELLPAVSERSGDVLGRPLGDGLDVRELVAEVKRHYVERALQEAGGNKTRAAALIGLPSQQTFTNWMESVRASGVPGTKP